MRFSWQALALGVVVALATCEIASPRAARGQTFTWNNATGNWSDPAMWVGGVAPVVGYDQGVLPATLIANPFITSYQNWIDPLPAVGGNWRINMGNETLMETSGGVPAGSVGTNTGTFNPTILLQNAFTTPSTYDLTATMITNDDDGLGLVFGWQPNGDYFRASLRQQSGGSFGHTQGLSVQKVVGGVATQLNPASGVAGPDAITQSQIDNRTPFDLKVAVNGNNYEVFFDGASLASGTDADLQPGKIGVYSWAQSQDTSASRAWGTEVQAISVSDGGGTLYSGTFTNASLPVSFRNVTMTNSSGVSTTTTTTGADSGNLGLDFRNGWVYDNTNGFVNATVVAPNTDFIGPAIAVDSPGATALGDYEMRVRLGTNDNDGQGVLVRVQDDNNFYRINFTNQAQGAGETRPAAGLSVQKVRNGVWSELFHDDQSAPLFVPDFGPGTPSSGTPTYDLSVRVQGDQIMVRVTTDSAVYDYPVITDAVDPLLTGSVGFTQWGDQGTYWMPYGGVPGPLVVAYSAPPAVPPQTIFGADTVSFGGAGAAYTSTYDGYDNSPAAFFMINKLNLTNNGAASTLSKDFGFPGTEKLGFAGPNAEINMTGTGDMTVAMPMMVFEDLAINVAAGAGTLRLGPNPAVSGIFYQGLGTITINNQSANPVQLTGIPDFPGTLNIVAGQVTMAQTSGTVLSTLTMNIAAGATFNLNGNVQTMGALTGAGTLNLGSGGAIAMTQLFDQDWSGAIIGGATTHGTAAPFNPTVAKIFTNGRDTNWIWRGNNSYIGETEFRGGGTVRLVDGGRISGTSDSTDADTTAITIMRTELILDNTGTANNIDRLRNAAEINLQGGLTLLGRDGTASTETVGAINMQTAAAIGVANFLQPPRGATVKVVNGAGGTATLTMASLARSITRGSNIDFAGDGTVVITTAPALTNGIIGGWATKGSEWATMSGTTVVPLATYQTSADPGTWAATDNVKISGALSANVDLNAGDKTINSLNFASNQTLTLDGFATLSLDSGGLLASTSGTITGANLTAASQQGNEAELRIRVDGASNTLTINSTITDSISGGVTLSKTGDGTLRLTGFNTFSGGNVDPSSASLGSVLIDGGVVEISDVSNLGLLSNNIIVSDGTLRITQDVDLRRTGLTRGQGNMILDTQGFTLTTSSIGGYGSVIKKGSGTLIIDSANSFDGDITVLEGMVQSQPGGVGSLLDNTTILRVEAGAVFDFNDNPEDFGALEGDGTVLTGSLPTTTLRMIALESRSPVEVFNGSIQGAGNVEITTYPFKQSFGGQSTYTGTTAVTTGGLIVTANALPNQDGPLGNASTPVQLGTASGLYNVSLEIGAAGVTVGRDVVVNGGDMVSMGGIHTTGTSTFSGGLTLSHTLYVTAAGTSTVQFSGNIVDNGGGLAGGLIKIGPGTVALGGANTYAGDTYVADGKLLVNGTNSGAGRFTIATDGTLGGTGTIAAPVTVYGTLAPGASVGTLSVANDVVLNGTLSAEVSGTSIDLLAITGGLTLGAASVLDIQGNLATTVTHVIATYNPGSLVGTFADATDATTHGYNVVYENSQITLDELDGDANHDGVVNIFDVNLVSANWDPTGPVGAFAPGNINHDTTVNIFDINLISANWNHVATNGGVAHSQPVPEPSSVVIALVGLVGFVGYRGCRRTRKAA
jgi:autotransporter-associated beta strand protein